MNLHSFLRRCFGFCSLLLLATTNLHAQPKLQFVEKITGLSSPVDIVNANDGSGRIFIVERSGLIKIYNSSFEYIGDFLTVAPISCCGERGLLSMAFHPDYESNGYFFVYYTTLLNEIAVARYSVSTTDPNAANPASKVVVITIPKNSSFTNHNGGDLNFGADGNLYFATGDGGGAGDPYNHAQRVDSLMGKMVRINVDNFNTAPYYSIPADNPFVNSSDTLPEIYALGLRNPWRWSFDRLTGDMYIADVGQAQWEEINFREAGTGGGANYGWKCYEGNHPYQGGCTIAGQYVPPVFEYPHSAEGGISVTGGFVYRGTAYPELYGYYVFADFASGNAWLMKRNDEGTWNATLQQEVPTNIVSFGENEQGEMFMATLDGTVYQVAVDYSLPVRLTNFSARRTSNGNSLQWIAHNEVNVSRYIIEHSVDGNNFSSIDSVKAKGNGTYNYVHKQVSSGRHWYRLATIDEDGSQAYSPVVFVSDMSRLNVVINTLVTDHKLRINLNGSYTHLHLTDVLGRMVHTQSLNGLSGNATIEIPPTLKGNFIVVIAGNGKPVAQNIVVQ